MTTPPKKYSKTLAQCKTREERVALVRQAMEDGHSYTSAAKALGLTKKERGVIAGICHKNKILSKHPKPPMYPKPIKRQKLKVAASEATQCTEVLNGGTPRRCAYERVEGLEKCPLHCGRRVKKSA